MNKAEKTAEIRKYLEVCDQCPKKDQALRQGRTKADREKADLVCKGCPFFVKLRELGKGIKDRDPRIDDYLAKGEDMTTKELLFLLENGVKADRLSISLNLSASEVSALITSMAKSYHYGL